MFGLMKCGHTAQGYISDTKKPVCVICYGVRSGADEPVDTQPDLTGRKAKCGYCANTVDSNSQLAFFEHRPDRGCDSFYCGCWGWD